MSWSVHATDGSDGPAKVDWPRNGLKFETKDEALGYSADLYSRWFGCVGTYIKEYPEEPATHIRIVGNTGTFVRRIGDPDGSSDLPEPQAGQVD